MPKPAEVVFEACILPLFGQKSMPFKEETVCQNVQWIDFSQPTQGEMEELAKRYGLNSYVLYRSKDE